MPDAVAEAVAEVLALPRLLDHLARDSVDLFAVRSRPDRGERPFLGREHELVDLAGPLGDPLAGCVRARAVRAVALVQRAPVDRHQHVRADLASRAARRAAARRARRRRRSRESSAPRRRGGACAAPARSPPRARCARRRPLRAFPAAPRRPARLAARMRSISPASLTARSRSTAPAQGTSSQLLAEQLGEPRVLLDGQALPRRSRAARRAPACGERRRRPRASRRRRSRGRTRRHLRGRLGGVAEVGEEPVRGGLAGIDQRQTVPAGEARQVAHVDRGRDEQHVELALAQLGREALRTHPVGKGSPYRRRSPPEPGSHVRRPSVSRSTTARAGSPRGPGRRRSRSRDRRSPTAAARARAPGRRRGGSPAPAGRRSRARRGSPRRSASRRRG